MTNISKLFIANRGEIARRIACTAKRIGIQTVAVCEHNQPPAYLLDVIDEFCFVDEESPALYLNGERMIELALGSNCDAIHPGFGFLSENDQFAAAIGKAGLIWVGPNPKAIATMASKGAARVCAQEAQVPLVPGLEDCPVPDSIDGDFSILEKFVDQVGLPVLIKAAFGGGGKGMRLVHDRKELKEAALRARSEGINSFGNGQLVVERYLATSRHVEVQVFGDQHGQAFAVGDRDCSIQRRHQKVLEEAPAPDLPDATRQAMHLAAANLAKSVGYDNAGTVEFLVDWSERSRTSGKPEFYFLEMNTRLQVEHPVTEEVFGVDLVEWQLRVARGEKLPGDWQSLQPRGHSIEARLYAEDTRQGFLPAPGPVAAFQPANGPGVRWETGLDAAGEITGRFDPMIAKLVVTGPDRQAAMDRMIQTLRGTFFAGPENNLRLIREILVDSPFRVGAVATSFLDEHLETIQNEIDRARAAHNDLAESLLTKVLQGAWGEGGANQGRSISAVTARSFGQTAQRQMTGQTGQEQVVMQASLRPGAAGSLAPQHGCGMMTLPDGSRHAFWYAGLQTPERQEAWVRLHGETFGKRVDRGTAAAFGQGGGGSDQIAAPVPGKVIAINVAAGATVTEGQALIVLESMKMEFEVKAARAGVIAEVLVAVGDQVEAAVELATWKSEED